MGKSSRRKNQTREDIALIKSVIPEEDFNQRLDEFTKAYGKVLGKQYTIAYYFDYIKKYVMKDKDVDLVIKK